MCNLHGLPDIVLIKIMDFLKIQDLSRLWLLCDKLKNFIEVNYNVDAKYFKKLFMKEHLYLKNSENDTENKKNFLKYLGIICRVLKHVLLNTKC